MLFWKNPEFIRHVRAELRPARAMTAGALALVICALVGLSSWGSTNQLNSREFIQTFYVWTMGIQFVVLTFWCASSCGHAISRERELKTYDFLKTTRLTSAELVIGKVLGVPILAYFTIGCSLPVSLALGLMGGFPPATIFWTYVLLLAVALFVSVMALWASMQVAGTSARSVGLLVIIPVAFGFSFAESPYPGVASISIFPALLSLYQAQVDVAHIVPTLFGAPVSFVLCTLVLYASLGAWFVLMLNRNLKKDIEEIRLLTRWQAIGFATFLNLLFYAFLDPKRVSVVAGPGDMMSPAEVATMVAGVNTFILFAIGIAMLAPHEKLKVWWRKHAAGEAGYFSESGPPWPWLIPAALVAYAMLAAEALGLARAIPLSRWRLDIVALQMFVCLVYVTRDVLFLQWANLTRMKRPVLKGFLYLCLYYTAAGISIGVLSVASSTQGFFMLGLLTPFGAFALDNAAPTVKLGIYVGLALQIVVIVLLMQITSSRLRRPAIVPAVSEG